MTDDAIADQLADQICALYLKFRDDDNFDDCNTSLAQSYFVARDIVGSHNLLENRIQIAALLNRKYCFSATFKFDEFFETCECFSCATDSTTLAKLLNSLSVPLSCCDIWPQIRRLYRQEKSAEARILYRARFEFWFSNFKNCRCRQKNLEWYTKEFRALEREIDSTRRNHLEAEKERRVAEETKRREMEAEKRRHLYEKRKREETERERARQAQLAQKRIREAQEQQTVQNAIDAIVDAVLTKKRSVTIALENDAINVNLPRGVQRQRAFDLAAQKLQAASMEPSINRKILARLYTLVMTS